MPNPPPHRSHDQNRVAQHLKELIVRCLVPFHQRNQPISSVKIAIGITRMIRRRRDEKADQWAAFVLDTAAEQHILHKVEAIIRGARPVQTRTYHRPIPTDRRLPGDYAVDVLDALGQPTGEQQYRLWPSLPWARLHRLYDQVRTQGDEYHNRAAAIAKALSYEARAPGSTDYMDACQRLGLDWQAELAQ